MRRALIAGSVLLALASAAIALGLPGVALNPVGTDAVAMGKLIIQGDAGRAPLNLPVFSAMPGSPNENEFWIVHNGSQHLFAFRAGGTTYTANATLTP